MWKVPVSYPETVLSTLVTCALMIQGWLWVGCGIKAPLGVQSVPLCVSLSLPHERSKHMYFGEVIRHSFETLSYSKPQCDGDVVQTLKVILLG